MVQIHPPHPNSLSVLSGRKFALLWASLLWHFFTLALLYSGTSRLAHPWATDISRRRKKIIKIVLIVMSTVAIARLVAQQILPCTIFRASLSVVSSSPALFTNRS